jgi:hypothetical protein
MRYPYRRLSDVLKNATYHAQNFGLKDFMEDLKVAYKKFGTDVAFVPISQTKSYVYIPGDQTPLGIVGYETDNNKVRSQHSICVGEHSCLRTYGGEPHYKEPAVFQWWSWVQ